MPPCDKVRVVAALVDDRGKVSFGENIRRETHPCPRRIAGMKSGEGYELCEKVCKQYWHAEEEALWSGRFSTRGAKMYIMGHYRACDKCIAKMKEKGVVEIIFPLEGKNVLL